VKTVIASGKMLNRPRCAHKRMSRMLEITASNWPVGSERPLYLLRWPVDPVREEVVAVQLARN